jgi:hypothetical protein
VIWFHASSPWVTPLYLRDSNPYLKLVVRCGPTIFKSRNKSTVDRI